MITGKWYKVLEFDSLVAEMQAENNLLREHNRQQSEHLKSLSEKNAALMEVLEAAKNYILSVETLQNIEIVNDNKKTLLEKILRAKEV